MKTSKKKTPKKAVVRQYKFWEVLKIFDEDKNCQLIFTQSEEKCQISIINKVLQYRHDYDYDYDWENIGDADVTLDELINKLWIAETYGPVEKLIDEFDATGGSYRDFAKRLMEIKEKK